MCRTSPCSCFSNTGLRVTIAPYDGRAAMRWCVAIGVRLVGGTMAGGDGGGIAAPNPRNQLGEQLGYELGHQLGPPSAAAKDATPSVDIELILAVDVSYSMDMDELAIQREGSAQAIVSKEFLQALTTGPNGKISP